jgi:beta-lactamase class A
MIGRVRAVLLVLATAVLAGAPPAVRPAAADEEGGEPEEALWAKLKTRLHDTDAHFDGVLGVSLKDLKTGATIEIRPGHPFPLASSIKLAVLYELYRQAEAGRVDLDEVTRPGLPRVGGGGVLQVLGDRVSLTWRDLAVLMMGWSDNEATNVLIDRIGMDAVNRRLDDLELEGTRLRRKMMDVDAARAGRENVGTPSEMRRLVETLYAGKGLSAARTKDIRAVAAVPKDSPFRDPLPAEGLAILDKPGDLEGVRCVTAVVDVPDRPYAISINTTFMRKDTDGAAVIREISAAVYETFDRLSRSSEYGRRMR